MVFVDVQVREMLEDDGIFYLQIAGLRRCWQFEDLTWYVDGVTGHGHSCVER